MTFLPRASARAGVGRIKRSEMEARPQQIEELDTGIFGVLSVRTPGFAARPAGIVLVDQHDRIYVRLLDTLFSADPDDLLVWETISEDLQAVAADLGGRGTLDWLRDTASNFIEIKDIGTCSIKNAEEQLQELFHEYVIDPRRGTGGVQNAELQANRFTLEDLSRARGSVHNSCAGALQAMRLLKSGGDDLAALEKIIEQDPHLATHVIRLANLAAHSRGGEIRSVRQALIQTGTLVVLGYMVAVSLRPLHSTPALRGIWNTSLATQAYTQSIGALAKCGDISELSLIGLTANIGQLVLFAMRGFEAEKESLKVLGYPPLLAERMLCGKTHAEVGADLLSDWGFPGDMAEAVRFHHSPSQTKSKWAALLLLAESSVASNDLVVDIDEHETALDRLGLTSTQVLAASVLRSSDRLPLYR